jgi:type IV secretion system protein VirB10
MSTPESERPDDHSVRGERAAALVDAARSVQSRVSSVLAAGLMITLGLSALTWYYAHALTRRSQARAAAQSTAVSRAQGEMPLPSLGRIAPPAAAGDPARTEAPQVIDATAVPEVPLAEARAPVAEGEGGAPPRAPARPAAVDARERRLTGAVFARDSSSQSSFAAQGQGGAPAANRVPGSATEEGAPDVQAAGGHSENTLAAWLRPSASTTLAAQVLPTARLLLPKGAFIDCTLETAIDSTLPGMTTCITAADTFSADGKVVLLERGTKLVGETRGQVQQGQARVFVAWSQARTPTGVIVPLDSPGTDELGRAGLPGQVERHFWQRFGAAMLISIVDGAVQAGVQASNRSGGAVVYAPSGSQDVLTEVLKGTVNIAPTVLKRNGDRIQVLVARDLDFRSVYELRASAAAP